MTASILTYAISEQKWLLNLTAFLEALFLKIYIGIWASTIGLHWSSNQLWNHMPRFLVNQWITFPLKFCGWCFYRFCLGFVFPSACNVGDSSSIPGSGRSSEEGNGNPLQYACWEIPWTEEPGRLQTMGLQCQIGLNDLTFYMSKSSVL